MGAHEAVTDRSGVTNRVLSPLIDLFVARVRGQLDDATFRTAWTAGREMTPGEVMRLAIEETAPFTE